MGQEEVWVEQTSQLSPFLASSPVILEGCVGVSSEYPCLQVCLVMERGLIKDFVVVCDRGEANKTFFLSFNILFLLYLENWGGGGEMLLLLQGWQRVVVL